MLKWNPVRNHKVMNLNYKIMHHRVGRFLINIVNNYGNLEVSYF